MIGDTDLEKTRLQELQASSSSVLDFVLFLGEAQFHDFWLPFVAHMLIVSVMVSLRCAVEAQFENIKHDSFTRLQRVMAHIQHAYENYDWDIASYCLERCSDAVTKISSYATRERESSPPPALRPEPAAQISNNNNNNIGQVTGDITANGTMTTAFDDPAFPLSDFLNPNEFDFSWEALWDTPSGINFTI
jgi:hypothetical protein